MLFDDLIERTLNDHYFIGIVLENLRLSVLIVVLDLELE